MLRRGRWFAVLCIFVLVAAALLAPATGGSHAVGILVPLAPLFGLVLLLAVRLDDAPPAYSFVALPPLPSRAPPRQLSTK
jgi:Sec-independent protein secretion pathway component TatC